MLSLSTYLGLYQSNQFQTHARKVRAFFFHTPFLSTSNFVSFLEKRKFGHSMYSLFYFITLFVVCNIFYDLYNTLNSFNYYINLSLNM